MPFWLKILFSIIAVEVLGGLGAAITSDQIATWYTHLQKPVGTPPNWLFGPVWISLYAMMGTAFAIIWQRAESGPVKRNAMIWFGAQLLLNLAWTPLFFGMHAMLAALVIIVILWAAIAITIIQFRRLRPMAAALLAPYLMWVSYATYLNAGYWLLNR